MPLAAAAAPSTDAGSLLRDYGNIPPKLPEAPAAKSDLAPARVVGDGVKVTVRSFQVEGVTVLPAETVQAALAAYVGRPLAMADLDQAAADVGKLYRDAGYYARAYFPEQNIGETIVLRVVEGRFTSVEVVGDGTHLDRAEGVKYIENSQVQGEAVDTATLDRILMVMDDLPGVGARGVLVPGSHPGETRLQLKLTDKPRLAGGLSFDNFGSRTTGRYRAVGSLDYNSPLFLGDQAALVALASRGTRYGRLAYSIPLGYSGLRGGVSFSGLTYELGEEFESLDAHGSALTVGGNLVYPMTRSDAFNWFLGTSYDHKKFDNLSSGSTTSEYSIDVLSGTLYGNLYDGILGGGYNSWSINTNVGRVDLDGSPNQSSDEQGTQTQGAYAKFYASASRLQHLYDAFSLYASVSGQLANKNLDSSERFALGGPSGVRGYPSNEASGDSGLLMNLELRYLAAEGFQVAGFYDEGRTRLMHDPHGDQINGYSLRSLGAYAAWSQDGYMAKLTYAHRVGDNPGEDASGRDNDGGHIENQLWLQLGVQF